MPCKSPDRAVYCSSGLADTETGDRDVIDGFWLNNNPQESMLSICVPPRSYSYSIKAKAV